MISRKREAATWKTGERESAIRTPHNSGISCTFASVKRPNSLCLQVSYKTTTAKKPHCTRTQPKWNLRGSIGAVSHTRCSEAPIMSQSSHTDRNTRFCATNRDVTGHSIQILRQIKETTPRAKSKLGL